MKIKKILDTIHEKGIPIMTTKEIEDFLKSCHMLWNFATGEVISEHNFLPHQRFILIVPNPDYDPDKFSQEIEDSEEEINLIGIVPKVIKESGEYGFWADVYGTKKNSEKWIANHSKKCIAVYLFHGLHSACINYTNGRRDHYSQKNMDKIAKIQKKYGGIIKII